MTEVTDRAAEIRARRVPGVEARAGKFPGPSLIPALNAIQARLGWLPREELEELSRDARRPLYEIEGLVSFYPHYRTSPPPAVALHVCHDLACWLRGGDERVRVPDRRRPLVHRDRGCGVAAAQAGHLDQFDLGVLTVALAQLGQPGLAVAQEARQVVAHVQRDLRRRFGAEVRVERDQALDLVERAPGVAGELLQLLAGQPAQARLDRVQRRDQRRPRELSGARLDARHPLRRPHRVPPSAG